jgi:hypothetical protein
MTDSKTDQMTDNDLFRSLDWTAQAEEASFFKHRISRILVRVRLAFRLLCLALTLVQEKYFPAAPGAGLFFLRMVDKTGVSAYVLLPASMRMKLTCALSMVH